MSIFFAVSDIVFAENFFLVIWEVDVSVFDLAAADKIATSGSEQPAMVVPDIVQEAE